MDCKILVKKFIEGCLVLTGIGFLNLSVQAQGSIPGTEPRGDVQIGIVEGFGTLDAKIITEREYHSRLVPILQIGEGAVVTSYELLGYGRLSDPHANLGIFSLNEAIFFALSLQDVRMPNDGSKTVTGISFELPNGPFILACDFVKGRYTFQFGATTKVLSDDTSSALNSVLQILLLQAGREASTLQAFQRIQTGLSDPIPYDFFSTHRAVYHQLQLHNALDALATLVESPDYKKKSQHNRSGVNEADLISDIREGIEQNFTFTIQYVLSLRSLKNRVYDYLRLVFIKYGLELEFGRIDVPTKITALADAMTAKNRVVKAALSRGGFATKFIQNRFGLPEAVARFMNQEPLSEPSAVPFQWQRDLLLALNYLQSLDIIGRVFIENRMAEVIALSNRYAITPASIHVDDQKYMGPDERSLWERMQAGQVHSTEAYFRTNGMSRALRQTPHLLGVK